MIENWLVLAKALGGARVLKFTTTPPLYVQLLMDGDGQEPIAIGHLFQIIRHV